METPKRIVVVDDEADVSTYLAAVLTDHGYEVRGASSGEEALRLVTEDRPDLVCLDLLMPERTGLWLYRQMCTRPELGGIPVVIISGLGKEQGVEEMLAGLPRPAAFMEKPVEVARLIETLQHFIGNGQGR